MCGILAVFGVSEKDKNVIIEASKQLQKRGPDSSRLVMSKFNDYYFFHRLSINDTSDAGMQPMTKNNIIMLCNGEIYNYKELIKEHDLKTNSNSDCEVILHLYEKIGFTETIKRLYGVFAVILVDNDIVYTARDRFGVRPLYYGVTSENRLAFCSVPTVLEKFSKNINHIEPGTVNTYKRDSLPVLFSEKVLDIENKIGMWANEFHMCKKIKETLIEAVRKRLISDRPIGCLLSGGLDSSIITAILCKLIGPENVRTYSIGMEGSTDLFYAKKVADFLGTKHTEVLFTPEQGFKIIPEVIQTLATYDITTIRASVGMYLISKYISTFTDDKVIFSGEGSDEVLQGYLYFHKAPTPTDGEIESIRLMKNLHLYDVLRCDRSISNNGLEPRVPFLDKDFVDLILSLPTSYKNPHKGYEKYILRKAFDTDEENSFLPKEILWRRKEGFSDGVSSMKKPWYAHIAEKVDKIIPDYLFNPAFPSKEAMYYKMIFDNLFPTYSLKVDYWMPKWIETKDPSGRLVEVD
jgi:asparagine synthase (glutamine-hydrolysing)